MKEKYKLSYRILACILLISLFLQSCSNSPILSRSLEAKHENKQDFTKGQSLEIGSHEYWEDLNVPSPIPKDHTLTLAEDQLPIAQVEEVIPSIDAQQFPPANHTTYPSSILTTKKITREKRMRLARKEISSNFANPQIDEKLSCLFKMDSGKRVKIYQQEEKWQAKVKEEIGVFRGDPYLLPVYFEPGMNLKQLAILPQAIQEQYIHINEDHVYIGCMGILGGGKDEKSMKPKKKKKGEEIREKGESRKKKRKKQKESKNTTKPRKKGDEEEETKKAASKRRKLEKEKKVQGFEKGVNIDELNDYNSLLEWATKKEDPEAQFLLGQEAYNSWRKQPTKEADRKAREWLGRAAIQRHQGAVALLQEMNSVMRPEIELGSKVASRKNKKTVREEGKQEKADKKMVRIGLTDIPEENFNLEYCVKEKAYLGLLEKDILPYIEKKNKKTPTCFISYAEGDHYHEQWVERFAKMLHKAVIEILLNRWVNKKGNLSNEFSKKMEGADWVIVVGTKLYLKQYNTQAENLQEKEHVTRLEGQLIDYLIRHSTEMGNKVIPILLEGTSEESLPFMLRPKIAAEFTINDYFEEILKLIRDLYKIDNRDKRFEGFIEKFKKYSSAAATTITPEERKAYEAKRTKKILLSDQKILKDITSYKEKAFNSSESSSDESSSDEGRRSRLRMTTFKDSTVPKTCPLHNYLPIAKLDDYIPRNGEQEKLHQALKEKGICVISGYGGIGKSTLVAEYGHKRQNKQVVWWMPAETSEKLITSYNKLAKELKIDYQELTQEFKEDMSQYLAELGRKIYNTLEKHHQPTLLILDNVTDPDLIAACLLHRTPLVQVLITTRDKKNFKKYSPIELGTFTPEEGKSYIQKKLGDLQTSETDISALVKEVGLIPQKLELATRYIGDTEFMDIHEYIIKLQMLKKEHKKTHGTLVLPEASLGLEKLDISAQRIMHYGAYLDPDFIPLSLITTLFEISEEKELDTTIWTSLQKLSLIKIINHGPSKQDHGIQIHREIQAACKEYQNWKESNEYCDKNFEKSLLKALAQCSPKLNEGSNNTKDQAKQYVSNIYYALKNIENAEKRNELKLFLAQIFDWIGDYNQMIQFDPWASLYYYKKSFDIKKSLYADNSWNLDIAKSLHHLGYIYKVLSKYQTDEYQAFILSRKAFKSLKKAYKMRWDLDTTNIQELASCLHLLGLICQDAGQYEAGLNYLDQALEMLEISHSNDIQQIQNDKLNLKKRKQWITGQLAKLTNELDLSGQQFTPRDLIYILSLNNSHFKENVQILTLSNNPLGMIVEALAHILPHTNIQELDLSGNELLDIGAQTLANALPDSHIHTLDLSDNQIGAAGVQELAKALPDSQIHTLYLRNNNIGATGAQELAKALPDSHIHTLDLRNNNIGDAGAKELAKALLASQIHTLDLSFNMVGAAGAEELAKVLPACQLHTLDLRNNNIGDAGAQELANALPDSQIHTLYLRNNNIGATGAQGLAKVLPASHIHTLDLRDNNIGAMGTQGLAKVLPDFHIHTLDLRNNNIGDAGAQELANALPESQIYTLYLRNNNIGATGAQGLAKVLPASQIHTLDLRNNNIRATGAQELANVLPESHIHTLDLGDNSIGSTGAQGLAKVLPVFQLYTLDLIVSEKGDIAAELAKISPASQIHTFDLSFNTIGDIGAEELAKALPSTQIHTLNLRGNQIGAVGAQELANVLPASHIHTLDLSWNNIGDEGTSKLAQALSSSKVHTLDLSSNNIGDAGAQELAIALPDSQIYTLYLRNNNIGATGAQGLAKVLPASQIHTLDLSDNQIGDAGAQELAKALLSSQIQTIKLSRNKIYNKTEQFLKEKYPHIRWYF